MICDVDVVATDGVDAVDDGNRRLLSRLATFALDADGDKAGNSSLLKRVFERAGVVACVTSVGVIFLLCFRVGSVFVDAACGTAGCGDVMCAETLGVNSLIEAAEVRCGVLDCAGEDDVMLGVMTLGNACTEEPGEAVVCGVLVGDTTLGVNSLIAGSIKAEDELCLLDGVLVLMSTRLACRACQRKAIIIIITHPPTIN